MGEKPFVRRVERDSVDAEVGLRLIRELEANGPMKPWTLLSRVRKDDEDVDALRSNALKPLTLKGYITPNADGDLRLDAQMSFREDYLWY